MLPLDTLGLAYSQNSGLKIRDSRCKIQDLSMLLRGRDDDDFRCDLFDILREALVEGLDPGGVRRRQVGLHG